MIILTGRAFIEKLAPARGEEVNIINMCNRAK